MQEQQERNHALDEGKALLAQEKRKVVLNGLRSDLDRRSNLLNEMMPVRAMIAGQEAGVVQSNAPSCVVGHGPIIPRVRTLPQLATRSTAVAQYAHGSVPPIAPPGANPGMHADAPGVRGGRQRSTGSLPAPGRRRLRVEK